MEFNISHLIMNTTAHSDNWVILSSIGGIISAMCAIKMAFLTGETIKNSQEQTNEIKRQFQEEHRAYIALLPEIKEDLLFLSIQNIGKQIAKNVQVSINDAFINQLSKDEPHYEHLKALSNSVLVLGVGQKYITAPFSSKDLSLLKNPIMKMNISYKDFNNSYNEVLEIDLSQYMWVVTSVKKAK